MNQYPSGQVDTSPSFQYIFRPGVDVHV